MSKLATCRENHVPPPSELGPIERPIGCIAGYSVFSGLIAAGGFGISQAQIAEVEAINATYHGYYASYHVEAQALYNFLNALQEGDMEDLLAARDAQIARLNEISLEIDQLWAGTRDLAAAVIGATAIEAYYDSLED